MALTPTVSQSVWSFSPQSIGGLALWLDGADSKTITYGVSPKVSSWKDKSVNGYNATQGTAGNQPSFNGSGVVFTNSAKTSLNTAYTSCTAPETTFAVVTPSATVVNPTNTAFTITSTSNGSANISISSRKNTSSVLTNSVVQFTGITQTSFGLSNGVNYYVISDNWTTGTTSTITLGLTPTTAISMTGNINAGGTGLMHQNYFTITATSNGSSSIAIGSRTNTTTKLTGSIITFSGLTTAGVGLSTNVLYYVLSDDWVSPNTTSNITLTITPYSSTAITMTGSTTTTSQCTCMFGYNILGSTVSSGRTLSIYGGKLILTGSLTSNPTTCMTSTKSFSTNMISLGMLYVTNTANANSFYMDGTLVNSTSSNVAIGVNTPATTIIGSQNTSLPFGFDGTIHEILCYSSTFTASQRQQVEGYLAWKWGLQGNLPSHPYLSLKPFSKVFVPTSISGCQTWLDAGDPSTMFTDTAGTTKATSGQTIKLWKDKSGNAYNATQATTENAPTLSSNGLSFNGTSTVISSSLTIPTQTHSIFIVYNPFSIAKNTNVVVFETQAGAEYINTPFYLSGTINPAYINSVGTTSVIQYNNNTPILKFNNTMGQTSMVGVVVASGSQAAYLNGNTPTTTTSVITTGTTQTSLTIGAWKNGASTYTAYFQGTVNEILIYNYNVSASQRQQIEGYLTWKWGLKSSLPGTAPIHPFKNYYPAATS